MGLPLRLNRHTRFTATVILFLAPTFIGLFLFQYLPLITAVRNSFYHYNLLEPDARTFAGFANYRRLIKEARFRSSLGHTVVFGVAKVVIQTPLALALALLVQRTTRRATIVRSAIFAPVVTSVTIIAVIWNLMYDPEHGLFNTLLIAFHLGKQPFLTSAGQALPAIIAMSIWQDAGFTMLLFLAGLQGIAETFYEAAAIDGANHWEQFRYITVPLLMRTILFAVVTTTVFSFQVFTPVYVMTKGGPLDATRVAVYYIYETAFVFLDMGYASALALVLTALLLIVAVGQSRLLRSRFEY